MKYKLLIVLFIAILAVSCDLSSGFRNYDLIKLQSHQRNESFEDMILADLKSDGSEMVVTSYFANNLGRILISDIEGKVLSQINIGRFRPYNLSVLKEPQSGKNWLFYNINNNENLSLQAVSYDWKIPLKREMKSFEAYNRDDELMSIDAYSWQSSFRPKILEDIDDDGKYELVCLARDGYSSNPRGVIVYDWESGKKKWFFRSPTVFNQIVFADLDGDHQKEFLLSNVAFNNNLYKINGLDDFSGHLIVLNKMGQMKYLHKVFEGLGFLSLNVEDVNQDGILDIFVVASTRGTNSQNDMILRLNYENKRLIRKKELLLPRTLSQIENNGYLHRLGELKDYTLVVCDSHRGILYYDTSLNEMDVTPQIDVSRIYAISELRKMGSKDIVALNKDNEVQVFDNKLHELARIPVPKPDSRFLRVCVLKQQMGNLPTIALMMDDSVVFYGLKRISFLTMGYRLLMTNALFVILVLVLVLIYIYIVRCRSKKDAITTLNQLREGVIIVRGKNRIGFINKAALAMAIEHDPYSSLTNLNDIFPELEDTLQGMQRSQSTYQDLELQICARPTKVHVEKMASMLNRYLIFLYQNEVEETTAEAMQWAETARRLSHHVRRHITNVILALDPLEKAADSKDAEYLNIIKGEIEKVRVFTHAFQRFTEMHDYDLKQQDIVPSLEHAIESTRIAENIKLIRDYTLNSIYAKIEPIRFEEAIVNTINNATEAMPEGGILHISIREFPNHSSPRGNLSVLVEIEDTGKGIPPKYMEDIWKPFFTTNQSGTGIGIPETHKIIASMGGLMDIQSEEGVGTTVSIWLKGDKDE